MGAAGKCKVEVEPFEGFKSGNQKRVVSGDWIRAASVLVLLPMVP